MCSAAIDLSWIDLGPSPAFLRSTLFEPGRPCRSPKAACHARARPGVLAFAWFRSSPENCAAFVSRPGGAQVFFFFRGFLFFLSFPLNAFNGLHTGFIPWKTRGELAARLVLLLAQGLRFLASLARWRRNHNDWAPQKM